MFELLKGHVEFYREILLSNEETLGNSHVFHVLP